MASDLVNCESIAIANTSDKDLSAKLYRKYPEKSTDSNRKPGIAIALGSSEVLGEWADKGHSDSKQFLPSEGAIFSGEILRQICHDILTASDTVKSET